MKEMNEELTALALEKDRNIRVLVLNLIGKILFLYGDSVVENIFIHLNKS